MPSSPHSRIILQTCLHIEVVGVVEQACVGDDVEQGDRAINLQNTEPPINIIIEKQELNPV
jgi:hypothetical protein